MTTFYWVATIMYAPSRLKLIALTMTTLLGTAAYTPHLSANNTKSAKTEVSQKALMHLRLLISMAISSLILSPPVQVQPYR